MNLIHQTSNGRLFFCTCCGMYQLEFGNIILTFHEQEFHIFKDYIGRIKGDSAIRPEFHLALNRKIVLKFPVKNIYFCLNAPELDELKTLLFIHKRESCSCQRQLIRQEMSLN